MGYLTFCVWVESWERESKERDEKKRGERRGRSSDMHCFFMV